MLKEWWVWKRTRRLIGYLYLILQGPLRQARKKRREKSHQARKLHEVSITEADTIAKVDM